MSAPSSSSPRLTMTQWLIVVLAAIGFAFDIYELLMAQYFTRPAIMELTGAKPGSEEYAKWARYLVLRPGPVRWAVRLVGGISDRSPGPPPSAHLEHPDLRRFGLPQWLFHVDPDAALCLALASTFVGVCVEFVAAVAWLAELFPEPRQRERVLGYTQAFSSVGGLLVSSFYKGILLAAAKLPAIAIPGFAAGMLGTIGLEHQHEDWRYLLMSGLIPAFPLIVLRPFLPESPAWAAKKAAGTLAAAPWREAGTVCTAISPHDNRDHDHVRVQLRSWPSPPIQQFQHMVAQAVPGRAQPKPTVSRCPSRRRSIRDATQSFSAGFVQEIGGLLGRFALALLALRILSRRWLFRLFQWPDLILVPVVFIFCISHSLRAFEIGIFLVGFFTVAQFSFWGNYLPRVYPVHLRGTGEGFAANIGGRMLGTSCAALTTWLGVPGSVHLAGTEPRRPKCQAYAAAIVATSDAVLVRRIPELLPSAGTRPGRTARLSDRIQAASAETSAGGPDFSLGA